jgi:hypothetical protein
MTYGVGEVQGLQAGVDGLRARVHWGLWRPNNYDPIYGCQIGVQISHCSCQIGPGVPIYFSNVLAQIRRPNNYDPKVAIMLGPTTPDPTMDLSLLDIVKTVVVDSPQKLFIGGLPCDWTEDQVHR